MKKCFLPLFLFLVASVSFSAEVPKWTGYYVNDYAQALSNRAELEAMLTELERKTSIEFAVVTLSSLPPDETMATYIYKIFNTWGIGKKEKDNGILFLMIINGTPGSRMRFEIGRGLEGYVPDAAAGRILDEALPFYTEGKYSEAVFVAVSRMKERVENIPELNGQGNYYDVDIAFLIGFFIFPILIPMLIFLAIAFYSFREKCPKCGSRNVRCFEENCVCKNCGNRFRKKKRKIHSIVLVGGGFGGGGFGGGGFGGGSSGGGGAGR